MCPFNISGAEAEQCKTYESKEDYVKVVRCKDCALRGNIIGWCNPQARYVGDAEFCSLGKRKEDCK